MILHVSTFARCCLLAHHFKQVVLQLGIEGHENSMSTTIGSDMKDEVYAIHEDLVGLAS